jgi:hypothetical protein
MFVVVIMFSGSTSMWLEIRYKKCFEEIFVASEIRGEMQPYL